MDLMAQRRMMIAAHPHLATASGSSVLVSIAEPKIERLAVTFAPMQPGSGDPSPTNVRTIYGHGTIYASIGTEAESISLGDTYWGGVVDLVSGTLTVTMTRVDLGNLTYSRESNGYNRFVATLPEYSPVGARVAYCICSCEKTYYSGESVSETLNHVAYIGRSGENRNSYLYIHEPDVATSDINTLLTGQYLVYELATPQTVTLTPQSIAALRGSNQTVTSPAGSIEITYWTH